MIVKLSEMAKSAGTSVPYVMTSALPNDGDKDRDLRAISDCYDAGWINTKAIATPERTIALIGPGFIQLF